MKRTLAFACVAFLAAGLAAAEPGPADAAYPDTRWEDLVPKDWDPLKDFKGLNLSMLRDGDPRATELLTKMRAAWDNAPSNNAMDNKKVRIPGFVVPLEEAHGGLKEFLLVPYFGACIHTPPPPSNQIVHVTSAEPAKGFRSMDAVWVSGTIKTLRSDSFMGASSYRMDSVKVEPFKR